MVLGQLTRYRVRYEYTVQQGDVGRFHEYPEDVFLLLVGHSELVFPLRVASEDYSEIVAHFECISIAVYGELYTVHVFVIGAYVLQQVSPDDSTPVVHFPTHVGLLTYFQGYCVCMEDSGVQPVEVTYSITNLALE